MKAPSLQKNLAIKCKSMIISPDSIATGIAFGAGGSVTDPK